MNKIIRLLLLLAIVFISCKNSEHDTEKLDIAKQYYTILDSSNDTKIEALLTDSISIKENEYDYVETFSKKGYAEWLKWDAVFNPTYKVLEIKQEDDIVKAKISKFDDRIDFLHKEPIISNEVIRFKNNKIVSVEKTKYVIFNLNTFVKNRDSLVIWISKNHPELNGFLYDQTENGGNKYLKAIELYTNR